MKAKTFYRPNLRELFPANTPADEPILLNQHFMPWREHIVTSLVKDPDEILYQSKRVDPIFDTTETDLTRYRDDPWKELYEKCQEHKKKYERRINSNKVLVLVHPLYLFLRHWNLLNNFTCEQAETYLKNFEKVIKEIPSRKLTKVLFEPAQHYACATSMLLEEGLVDQVVFTEFDDGKVMDEEELKKFLGRQIYIGGAYNHLCLRSSLSEVISVAGKKVKVVENMVLDSPGCRRSILNPSLITYRSKGVEVYIDHEKIISLDQLLEEIQ